jgi:hypothetical protein
MLAEKHHLADRRWHDKTVVWSVDWVAIKQNKEGMKISSDSTCNMNLETH